MTDALLEQLIRHEGKRAKPYMDTVGKLTIGVGRNLSDVGLREDEILYLLNNDVDECVADLATFPWFARLDAIRQRVVIDLRFNLGPTRFRTLKRTLRLIDQGDYDGAANALRNSLWAKQVKGRADRLIQMMRTGAEA